MLITFPNVLPLLGTKAFGSISIQQTSQILFESNGLEMKLNPSGNLISPVREALNPSMKLRLLPSASPQLEKQKVQRKGLVS